MTRLRKVILVGWTLWLAFLSALALVMAGDAQAEELSPWAIDTVGLHVYTRHNPDKPWFADQNPGVQIRTRNGLTLGTYCNSYSSRGRRAWDSRTSDCEVTTYVGWMFETDRSRIVGVGVAPTALFGYKRGVRILGEPAVLHPMPNVRLGPARVYILSPKDFHLSLEYKFD